jgi:hypothetical protein
MAHHVFIRLSSNDEPVSDAGRATMGTRGIRCRMAPTDVLLVVHGRAATVDAIGAIRAPSDVVPPCVDQRAAIVGAIQASNGMRFQVPR